MLCFHDFSGIRATKLFFFSTLPNKENDKAYLIQILFLTGHRHQSSGIWDQQTLYNCILGKLISKYLKFSNFIG